METHLNQQLQVITGNLAPVPTGSMLPKIGDEQELSRALTAPQLRNTDAEAIKQVLRYAMVKVGLRAANWPQDEEKAILLAHVLKEYGNHTADEIRLAFDMALASKLDIGHKDAVCYENFSCLYFSGIMNSYRRWAAQAYRHAVVELPPPTKNHPRWEVLLEYALYLQKGIKKRLKEPLK